MAFEINYITKDGSFNVKLNREVSNAEANELLQLAQNILGVNVNISHTSHSYIIQRELGTKPVDTINLGFYKEPKTGVRIKLLNFPKETSRLPAIRFLRTATNISMMGCKDIIYGNYPCPLLSPELVSEIVLGLNQLGIGLHFENIA